MILALSVLCCGMATIGGLLAFKRRSARMWASDLQRYRMQLPAGLTVDDVSRWLGMVAATTSIPMWSARPPSAIALEVRASGRNGIAYSLHVPKHAATAALQSVRAGLPGTRLEPVPDDATSKRPVRFARELRLTSSRRPLAVDRAEAVATAFLMSLQPLTNDQEVHVVWQFGGASTPKLASFPSTDVVSGEATRALRIKDQEPQLLASVRIGAMGSSKQDARALVTRTMATLRGMNAPGVHITYCRLPSSRVTAARMARQTLPLNAWMLLNTRELSGLIGLPVTETFIPGLSLGTARQLPPSPSAPRSGVVLGQATYPGTNQLLRIRTADRLRSLWLLGPTGVGKSTLIASMALQDAVAGNGFALVDPKGDLVADVLSRLPASRHDDVIVLDPTASAKDQPVVGLNLLGHAHTEAERELVVDQVVHIFSSIWADSWGPRTADALHNSLLTLASTKGRDGSAFTLIDVAELLENAAFRRFVTGQATVPETVRSFWTSFERVSEQQQLQIIGPSLNKLRAVSTRSSLRLMLGQSQGVNVADVLNRGRILMVPLSKGAIGTEAAQLLGSLVAASLTNAIFARSAMPATQRRPVIIYLDEFQDVLRLPLDIADALAQARGLGAGFVLANQYISQLPDTAKRAVFGTVRSSIVFQLQDYDDARLLERRFAPLTASDLMHLPAYEIAAQLCENNTATHPVTGITLPLPDASVDNAELARRCASRYGVPRADVETAIRARTTPTQQAKHAADGRVFGRRKLGGGQ